MRYEYWRARLVGLLDRLPPDARELIDELINANQTLTLERDALLQERADLKARLAELEPKAPPSPTLTPVPAFTGRGAASKASQGERRPAPAPRPVAPEPEPVPMPATTDLPPTTRMVISISTFGLAKRTQLNAYQPQRRGGMGIFDIKLPDDDPIAHLAIADRDDALLVLTNFGTAHRIAVADIREDEIRARGEPLPANLRLPEGASIAAVLPLPADDTTSRFVLLASASGFVRRLNRSYLGPQMAQASVMLDPREAGGPPVALALSSGAGDIVLATQGGQAIRFPESAISLRGIQGIKLRAGDRLIGMATVSDADAMLFVAENGLGTRRLMSAFAANQSPGGQGKVAMKTDHLVAAVRVVETDEVFCISRHSKIIRFPAAEVPAKEAAVQGVVVMEFRGDGVAALAVTNE